MRVKGHIVRTCLVAGAAVGVGLAGAEMGQVLWEQAVRPRNDFDIARAAVVQEIPLSTARQAGCLALEGIAFTAVAVSYALDRRQAS